MKCYRIYISSWTASFRYPNIISGFQPTLLVPPVSTLWGLISAAKGEYMKPCGHKLGYYFEYTAKCTDLETVYQFDNKNSAKSNVIKREFLVDTHLFIYTVQEEIKNAFEKPVFQLLIGRSNDLASVQEIKQIHVEPIEELKHLRGTTIPFDQNQIFPAPIQPLSVYFSNDMPRTGCQVYPYSILEYRYRQPEQFIFKSSGAKDPEKQLEIYWHEN